MMRTREELEQAQKMAAKANTLWKLTVEEVGVIMADNKDLYRANLESANLRSADLRSANLYRANLESADLYRADLRSANLRSAALYRANLESANLRSADLRSANLRSANLRSANLESADLYRADLRSANLRSANLRSANLRSADLESADLESADLESADLRSADLGENRYIRQLSPIGSNKSQLVVLWNKGNVVIQRGCFCGDLEAFRAAVAKKLEGDPHRLEYEAVIVYLETVFAQWQAAMEKVKEDV